MRHDLRFQTRNRSASLLGRLLRLRRDFFFYPIEFPFGRLGRPWMVRTQIIGNIVTPTCPVDVTEAGCG
jgi:hypothetical protein